MSINRRDVLTASLAGATAVGVAANGAVSAETKGEHDHAPASPALVNLYDYEAAAKRILSVPAWEYFNGGSADEITLKRNRQALDLLQLKPKVLVDVSTIDTSRTLLGHNMAHPIILAPTSSHLLAHPDAEVATARGAASAKAVMVASTVSNRSIEDICAAASEPIWFQLYVEDDRAAVKALIERAESAGCKALCITVDNPLAYARNREERVRSQAPMLPFP
jgi:4-hydroxymandelate oxidase